MTAYFAEDPQCRVVGLFLETVRRPAAFEEALRRIAEAGKVGDRAEGRHVRDGRPARRSRTPARWSAPTGAFSAMLRYYNAIRCDDFGTWLEHLEVFSRASSRPAAGGSAPSPTRAARASTSPTRPSRRGSRCSCCRTSCPPAIKQEFPNFTARRQPGRLLGDRRRPRRLPARVPVDGRVRRVRRAGVGHRPLELADRAASGELAQNIADDLRAACDGTDIFPCVITVTTACPPVEDLRWAREHDIPMLKGSLPGPARPGLAAATTGGGCRRARDVQPAAAGRRAPGALAELDSAEIAAAYGVPVRAGRALRHRGRRGGRRRADRLPGGRQDRQRRPQGAGRRRRAQPAGRLAGAGRGRADGRPR